MKALGSVSWTPQETTTSPLLCPLASVCLLGRVQVFVAPRTVAHWTGSSVWNSPSENTAVGWHFLLQGIFLTQGLNTHLLRLLH